MATTYSSVSIDASGIHRSPWVDARNTDTDQIVITVPANVPGVLTIEGSDSESTILAENATLPRNSDGSAASATDVTSSCTFDRSLTVSESVETVLTGTYAGSKKFLRVVWTPTAFHEGSVRVTVESVEPGDFPGSNSILGADGEELTALRTMLDVRRYVPVGELLTQDTFQDALEAAYAHAVSLSKSLDTFPSAQARFVPRYQVLVPEGLWKLTRTVMIPSQPGGTPQYVTPGISGVDRMSTGFIVDINDFTATNNAIFSIGGDSGDDLTWHPLFEKFNVQAHGAVADDLSCFVSTLTIWMTIRDVMVFGVDDTTSNPNHGWAVKILDTGTASNNQYPRLQNCHFQNCSGGVYAINCAAFKAENVDCRQNTRFDAIFSSCTGSWNGGSLESGAAGVNSPYYMSKGLPRIMSGWSVVEASGTGASLATASGDLSIVTGLSGMALSDQYKWLYLEKNASAYDGTDKVSGYYLITRYISATSVEIRKGSSHASTGSLIWSTCSSGQLYLELGGMAYHEAECFALVGMYALADGAGSVFLRSCQAANCDYAIETLGTASRSAAAVSISGVLQAPYVKARFCPSIYAPDAQSGNIGSIDAYSREGLVYRGQSYTASGETAFLSAAIPGSLRSSTFGPGNARTMCRAHGAVAMLDARQTSSFSKSGADITTWTDLIGGYNATLVNAAKYPQYSASDAKFGGAPSVTFTGDAANANVAAMTMTIPSAAWGTERFLPCIVMVAATDGVTPGAGRVANMYLLISGVADMGVILPSDGAASYIGGIYPPGDSQALAQTPDAEAHVFIHGAAGRSGPRISTELGTKRMSNFVNNGEGQNPEWAPADATLLLPRLYLTGAASMSVAFAAVFPNGLSYLAREQLLDQLCEEFAIPRYV